MKIVQSSAGSLERREAVRALLADRGDALLISGLGSPTYDVFSAGDSPANFYLWGAMGGAALMGLGLALAEPEKSVIVVTGDGEQLMGLGGLVTLATHAPKNLTIVVLDNGHYGETGMQPSHTGRGLALDAVAQSMGFDEATRLESMDRIREYAPTLASPQNRLRLAVIPISAEETAKALPPRDGVYLKNRFRQHLGLGVN